MTVEKKRKEKKKEKEYIYIEHEIYRLTSRSDREIEPAR